MNVQIMGTKHNVKCLDCGHKWGVYLDQDNKLPDGWNVCLKCASKNLDVKKENVNNEIQQVFSSESRD